MKKFIVLAAAVWAGSLFGALQLAKDGKTDYVISGDIKSQPVIELKTYLEKMSGAKFSVCGENNIPAGKNVIYVGNTAFARKNGIDFEKYAPEAWSYQTFGKNIVIGGHPHHGNLYAVSNFLEREFGCHWFYFDGEEIPQYKELILKTASRKGQPSWLSRQLVNGFSNDSRNLSTETVKAATRAYRLNGSNLDDTIYNSSSSYFLNCHNLYYLLPPEKYFKEHPEYYPMDLTGKRIHGSTKERAYANICFTNKDAARISAENLIEIIKRDRSRKSKAEWPVYYVIHTLDACNFLCYCPECKSFSSANGGDSALIILYVNRIAELVGKKYPEITLVAPAASDTSESIPTFKPLSNVQLRTSFRFTQRDCFRPLTHPVNAKQFAIYNAWNKISPGIGLWDHRNMGMSNYGKVPRVDTALDGNIADLKLYHTNGLKWYFVENQSIIYRNPMAFRGLEDWVMCQMMNDMTKDPDELIKIYMKGYYGPAAEKMTAYLNLLREKVRNEKTAMVALNNVARSYQTGPFMHQIYDMLHAALKTVPENSAYATRIRREMINPLAVILYSKGLKTSFDKKAIADEYRKYRTEQIKLFCRKSEQSRLLKELEKDIKNFTFRLEIPTPEQFKNIPEHKIFKFGYDRLTYRDNNKFVQDDPDSTIGKSICAPKAEGKRMHGGWLYGYSGMRPMTFLIYNWNTKDLKSHTIGKSAVKDEKFHWYKLGTFEFKAGRVTLMTWWWYIQMDLSDVFVAPDGTNEINIYDVWYSAKITGPTYFPGSKQKDGIYLDQVILIRK
ncbi:MAG: DUF4838 domain-containing protein [Lentisphaeria bacterium]|nr:DUF4838 domain-containing protein [Lentisphaeria bacterium]